MTIPSRICTRFQRRELLRLGAAQVLGVKDVRQVGRELADLADGIVDQALKWAWEELLLRWGAAVGRVRSAGPSFAWWAWASTVAKSSTTARMSICCSSTTKKAKRALRAAAIQ